MAAQLETFVNSSPAIAQFAVDRIPSNVSMITWELR
jgi:hypothetical protein